MICLDSVVFMAAYVFFGLFSPGPNVVLLTASHRDGAVVTGGMAGTGVFRHQPVCLSVLDMGGHVVIGTAKFTAGLACFHAGYGGGASGVFACGFPLKATTLCFVGNHQKQ